MTGDENRAQDTHPVLLCFDGSNDAATAIAKAGELLGPRTAVVLTVWEPVALWELYDPATILTAPLSKLASKELGRRQTGGLPSRARPDLRFGAVSRKARAGERSATRLRSLTPSRSWSVPAACRVSSRRSWAACHMPSSCTRTARCSSSRAAERSHEHRELSRPMASAGVPGARRTYPGSVARLTRYR